MKIRSWACAFLALSLLACQSIQSHHELDADAPFEKYVSFAWLTQEPFLEVDGDADPGGARFSPVHEELIRAAVERRLGAKGYEESTSRGAADIVLVFTLGTREEIQVDSLPVQEGYRYGPYHPTSSNVSTFTEGTLSIDVFDGGSKQMVWRGWATKRLAEPSETYEPRDSKDTIDRVVDTILREFPARVAGVE